MLEVINLDFDYQDEPLLKNVAFHIPPGGLLHLKGANGAGKTTLLKLIAGLYKPSVGHIRFMGQPIENDLQTYQRQICLVGHKTGVSPNLTIKEHCFFDVHYGNRTKNLSELVSIFKLEHHIDQPCGLLSAGQRRQVGLLRLWMTDAPLWILDEPLVALDEDALQVLTNQIQLHRNNGGAVILTSHQNLPLSTEDYKEYLL